mmetsp:Transcript_37523/g.119370  ORF Transcript_37523/g.119370 Transcript_37523/m.119370 type:complete len:229 (-) Transcript_37523:147-833(-)
MARLPAHMPSRQMQHGSAMVAVSGRPLPRAESKFSSSRSSRFHSGPPPSAESAWNIRDPPPPAPLVPPAAGRMAPAEAGRVRGRAREAGRADAGRARLRAAAAIAESGWAQGQCQASSPVRGRAPAARAACALPSAPTDPQLDRPSRAILSRAALSCSIPPSAETAATPGTTPAPATSPPPVEPPPPLSARDMTPRLPVAAGRATATRAAAAEGPDAATKGGGGSGDL